jgi:hypothetical protein
MTLNKYENVKNNLIFYIVKKLLNIKNYIIWKIIKKS